MGYKYQLSFKNVENVTCTLYFNISGYTGEVTQLASGTRPFVLREFNTDMDYYKPIRPMQAEIQILAVDGLSIDDFISEATVDFYYGSSRYWSGKIIQDEFQEYWIDTEHIFTIRATDNFDKELSYPYKSGQASFLDVIANVAGNLF